jgi:hypothetical protein
MPAAAKKQPNETDKINAALELVFDLASQNVIDVLDNPGEHRRQMAALDLVQETFRIGEGR